MPPSSLILMKLTLHVQVVAVYIFFWVIECEPLNSHEMYGEIESE